MGSHSERDKSRANNNTIIIIFIEHVLYARCCTKYLKCLTSLSLPNKPMKKVLRQFLRVQGIEPIHLNGGRGGRFSWWHSRKGQNKVALYLELECPHYTISEMTDSEESENKNEAILLLSSFVYCVLLKIYFVWRIISFTSWRELYIVGYALSASLT